MKRNLDLIRHVLLAVERELEPFGSDALDIDGFDSAEIFYHVGLMAEAGFIHASKRAYLDSEPRYLISALTYAGHDYLDAVRSAKIWQGVKDVAKKAGISLTVTLAKDIAARLLAQAAAGVN